MRVTVLILGLLLGLLMFIQTVLVYGLSSAGSDTEATEAGAIGIFMALMWLVACAFVLPLPMVSVVVFVLAGILGFAASGEFPDLGIWGGISLALALLSFFGWRGKRKEAKERREELARQANRDKMLEDMMRRQS